MTSIADIVFIVSPSQIESVSSLIFQFISYLFNTEGLKFYPKVSIKGSVEQVCEGIKKRDGLS